MAKRERVPDLDPYEVLGVLPTASREEIRAAYLRLVKQHHPDRHRTYVQKMVATRRLQEVNAAWEILRDPARRAEHDLHRAAEPSVPAEPRPRRRPGRWDQWTDSFFMDDRLRWPRRTLAFALFAVAWWLAWLWLSGPPPNPDAPAWTQHPLVKFLTITMVAPFILMFGAAFLGTYVLLGIFAIMLPVIVFQEAWKKARQRPADIKADLLARLVILALASLILIPYVLDTPAWLGVAFWLMLSPAVIGVPFVLIEIAALIGYAVWSRRVVATTTALVRLP